MILDRPRPDTPPSVKEKPFSDDSDKKRQLDQLLDEALAETFPGSDAIAIIQPVRRQAKRLANVASSRPSSEPAASATAPSKVGSKNH